MELDPFQQNLLISAYQNNYYLPQVQDPQNASFSSYSVATTLKSLAMPCIGHYCQFCTKRIEKSRHRTCNRCQRTYHLDCPHPFLNLDPRCTQCFCCETSQKCLNCQNPLQWSMNSVSCSMCLRSMHPECCKHPIQLFQLSRTLLQPIYGPKSTCRKTVCSSCQRKWLKHDITQIFIWKEQKYYLMKVKHHSPVHFIWKSALEIDKAHENMDEQYSVISDSKKFPQIQTIFSVCLPPHCRHWHIQDLLKHMREQNVNKPDWLRCKFLVRWSQGQTLIWQDEEIIKNYYHLLPGFLFKMEINLTIFQGFQSINRSNAVPFQLKEQLKMFQVTEEPKMIIMRLGVCPSNTEKVQQKVYQLYKKKVRQSVKSKNQTDPNKVQLIGRLINTIYFHEYNTRPVVLYTHQARISWWMENLKVHCPQHHSIALYGTQNYIKNVVRNHFFTHKKINYFNIILIAHEHLEKMKASFLNLRQLNFNAALLIMEENTDHICQYFFETCKAPKIKLTVKNQDSSSFSQLRLNHSSVPSLPSKDRQTIEIIDVPSENTTKSRQSALKTASFSHRSYSSDGRGQFRLTTYNLAKCHFDTASNFAHHQSVDDQDSEQGFGQMQRIVFLRYVMAFGFNFISIKQLVSGILFLEKSFFEQWPPAAHQTVLYNYTHKFMAALNTFSKATENVDPELQNYFFLNIKPKDILKRIVVLKKLKQFYETCSVKRGPQEPIFEENQEFGAKTFQQLDMMICQAILERGFGRWDSVSEYRKIWTRNGKMQSFRQYISRGIHKNNLSIDMFSKFLERRASQIMTFPAILGPTKI